MLYHGIRLYLDDFLMERHWEAYPFTIRHHWCRWEREPFFQQLIDRGIKFVQRPQDADCIITTNRERKPLLDPDIPTILIEGRDCMPPLDETRHILNTHPNVTLWKWGALKNHEEYLTAQWVVAAVKLGIYKPYRSSNFDPDQLKVAFNLFWHPYHGGYHHFLGPKPIDVAFMGTVDQRSSSAFKITHRKACIAAINKLPNHISRLVVNKTGLSQYRYCNLLSQAKICVSPYGNSEICGRDGQGLMHDCVVVRPKTVDWAETWPDVWSDAIECEPDYSDFQTVIEKALDEWDEEKTRAIGKKWRAIHDDIGLLADRVVGLLHSCYSTIQ